MSLSLNPAHAPTQPAAPASPRLARVEALHREHYGYLWRVLRHLGVAPAYLDDACQEVFVVVHRRIDEFEGRADVTTWLFAIARRVAADHRRAQRRTDRRHAALASMRVADDELVDPVARADAADHVHRFLDGLDDDKRAIFTLWAFEELRGPEIAERLEMNLNTVYSRLRIARAEFEQCCRHLRDGEREAIAAAQVPAPRREQRVQAWVLLLPRLQAATPWSWASAAASAKLWLGGAAVSAAIGVGLWPTIGASTDPARVGGSATPEIAEVTTLAAAPRSDDAAAPTADAPPPSAALLEVAPPPAPTPAAAQPSVAPPATRTTRGRASRANEASAAAVPVEPAPAEPAPAEPAPPPAPPAVDAEQLAAETALVTQMRAAARDGDHGRVLALVGDHQARFPRGRLAAQRLAYEATARCASGQLRRGRAVAERYLDAHPQAVLATSVRNACFGR